MSVKKCIINVLNWLSPQDNLCDTLGILLEVTSLPIQISLVFSLLILISGDLLMRQHKTSDFSINKCGAIGSPSLQPPSTGIGSDKKTHHVTYACISV